MEKEVRRDKREEGKEEWNGGCGGEGEDRMGSSGRWRNEEER